MARPVRDPSGISTKDRITAAATDLFEARGFDRVTVEDIALSTGVTQRTVFRYFNNKAALVLDPIQFAFFVLLPPTAPSLYAAVTSALDDLADRIEAKRAIVVRHTHVLYSSVALRAAAREIGDRALQTLRTDLARILGEDETAPGLFVLAEIVYAVAFAARNWWVENEDIAVADVLHESLAAASGYFQALSQPA
jgi:AcrR family transcriptional regulator